MNPPRGISPTLLLDQVKNAVPFIFRPEFHTNSSMGVSYLTYLRTFFSTSLGTSLDKAHLRTASHSLENSPGILSLSHEQYFELCLSAHQSTQGSFSPIHLGHLIHYQLWHPFWHPSLRKSTIANMAFMVTKSYAWDSTWISTRWLESPLSGERLSMHCGEWFSTAAAAYAAMRIKYLDCSADLRAFIIREIQREAHIFKDFRATQQGIGILKAAALISHNLKQLYRVIELWELADDDPLREAIHQATRTSESGVGNSLFEAIRLNQQVMPFENQSFTALQQPRCLRRSSDFLLPIGPFYDDWGTRIATHPKLSPEEVGHVVEALVEEWESQNRTVGYTRALAGILANFPGGMRSLKDVVPIQIFKTLQSKPLNLLCSISKKRFEDQWSQMALDRTQTLE